VLVLVLGLWLVLVLGLVMGLVWCLQTPQELQEIGMAPLEWCMTPSGMQVEAAVQWWCMALVTLPGLQWLAGGMQGWCMVLVTPLGLQVRAAAKPACPPVP